MIEIAAERLLTLNQVPKLVPTRANGRRVHISTIYRWVQRGVNGIRLETIRVGGTTCTSMEALQRFCDRLSRDDEPAERSPERKRKQSIDRVGSELDGIGIGVQRKKGKRHGN